jgi:hypothetical protein
MAKIQEKRSFKAINFDDANEYLEDGDTRGMLNIRVGYSENGDDGIITNVKGTKSLFSELSFSLPSGVNKCVGTCTDDQNNRLIWFNYNSNSSHGIYAYNSDTNTIDTILVTSVLNFSGNIIHSIDILNNNLVWVDENRPRTINVSLALSGVYANTIEELITDAKVVPMLPPVCTSVITTGSDYIKSLKSFQFIYRYVFINGEKSAWSTVSKLVPTGYKDNHISKIILDVSGCELFTKTRLRQVIQFVEFASRELYTLNFNQFLRITTTDLVASNGLVDYLDTESKTPVDTAETNIAFYENPIKAGTVCFQNDRKFYADCTEGYDAFNLSPSLSDVNIQVIPASGGIPYLSDCNTHIYDRYLKPDSEYSYAVEFKDKYGRKSGAISFPELTIKTQEQLSNDYKANVLQFGLNLASAGSFPEWADTFEILRSDNKTITYFVQGRVNNIQYCTGYDSNGDPVYIKPGGNPASPTNPNTSDSGAIEIHIDISNWSLYNNNIGYSFTEGDRLTFFTTGGNGTQEQSGASALKGLKIKSIRGGNLIVDYPQIGRTNLNSAQLTNTTYNNGTGEVNALTRIMVGDNGVALYSQHSRLTIFSFDSPFPFSNVSKILNFPITSNNLHGVSLIYGSPVDANSVDVYIVGSNGYMVTGNYNPSGPTFHSWNTVNTGTAADINCIESSFANHNKSDLIMVGQGGLILKYTRGSGAITVLNSGTTENLNHVYRNGTSSNLIAVGDNGTILKTIDNGNSWTKINPVTDFCQNLNGVYFDGVYAFAVGDEGLVLYSSDSGVTWIQTTSLTKYNLNSVDGDGSPDNIYIAGENGYVAQFTRGTGRLFTELNANTNKNINFFQSFISVPGTYFDQGVIVGDYDLLQDVNVPSLTFGDYSGNVEGVYGSLLLNYAAKIEIYSPKTTEGSVIYYETGDAYKVGQNYVFNKGKESDGDVFLIKKDFQGNGWIRKGDLIFSMTPDSSNTGSTWDKDLGRPNIVLLYPEKQERRNIVRFSDKYVQDSKINGLSNFQESNYELIPNEYGWVRKLTALEYVILINAERECATAYIDQTVFTGGDGQDVAATSAKVINNVRKLAGGFGCTNPESLVSYLGSAYWFSSNKGSVCRYNNANGVFPISEYKARTYFNSLKLANGQITSGVEPRFKNTLLTIKYPNLLLEGDFGTFEHTDNPLETPPLDWHLSSGYVSNMSRSNAFAHTGTYSLRVDLMSDLPTIGSIWGNVTGDPGNGTKVLPNTEYIIEGYVLRSSTSTNLNGAKIYIVPATDGVTYTVEESFIVSGASVGWNYLKTTINTGDNTAVEMTTVIECDGLSGVTGVFYFDDFAFRKPGETIAFQEGSARWISKYSFLPERYGYVTTEMYSFLNGELWKHDASNTYNNFHGSQYTSQVNPVFNTAPSQQKNYTYLSLEADKVWSVPSMKTPEGQESFILSGHFEKIQNEWYADIKNDIHTPNMLNQDDALINGDFMQSNTLNVLLETQASDLTKLRFVNVYSNNIDRVE